MNGKICYFVIFIQLILFSISNSVYAWSCYSDCSLCQTEYMNCLRALPHDQLSSPLHPGVYVDKNGKIITTDTHKEACDRQKAVCTSTCGPNCKDPGK